MVASKDVSMEPTIRSLNDDLVRLNQSINKLACMNLQANGFSFSCIMFFCILNWF